MASLLRNLALTACTLLSLASTASAGINTWTGVGPEGGEISNLVITSSTPPVAYALTPDALYRSNDTARTWTQVALVNSISDLAVHPTQTNRVFMVSNGDLLASTDGGVTRADVTPSTATSPIHKVNISQDGALLYVTDGRIVYRSSDFGATWTPGASISVAPQDIIQTLYIDPANANRVIAVITYSRLMITTDAGDHWTAMPMPPSIAVNDIAIMASGQIWAATVDGLWHTSDAGLNWTLSALTGVIAAVAVNPTDPAMLYAQVNSSIYRSTDGGAQWTQGNGTYSLWAVSGFAFDPQVRDRVLIATPNGIWVSGDAGANWSRSNSGIVATTPSRFTASTTRTYFVIRGQIYYLESDGRTVGMLDHNALSQALSFSQFDFLYGLHADRLPTGDRLFVSEGSRIARSTDGGQTWVRLDDPLFGNQISANAFGVAPDNPNLVLAVTSKGVMQSADGGDHWTAASGIAATTWINNLAMAPAGVAYAAGGVQIYKTTTGGLSWSALDLSLAAPDTILSVLAQGDIVYVSTNTSVYKSSNAGASWARLSVFDGGWLAADATGLYVAGNTVQRSVDAGNTWRSLGSASSQFATGLNLDPNAPGRLLLGTWYRGANTYTVATDLAVTATGQPSVPPASGARTEITFTVTNRGPHVASGVRLNITVADGRSFYQNTDCSVAASASSQAICTVGEIASGQSKTVRIESSFETAGSLGITASVAGNETELAATDNSVSQSWSYVSSTVSFGTVSSNGGGGGGALAWWMLVALAGIAVESRRAACYRR